MVVKSSPKILSRHREKQQQQKQQEQEEEDVSAKQKRGNALERLFQRKTQTNGNRQVNHSFRKQSKKQKKKDMKTNGHLSNLLGEDSIGNTNEDQNDDESHHHPSLNNFVDWNASRTPTSTQVLTPKKQQNVASPQSLKKRIKKHPVKIPEVEESNSDHDNVYLNTLHESDTRHQGYNYSEMVELNNSGAYGADSGCTFQNAWNMLRQFSHGM